MRVGGRVRLVAAVAVVGVVVPGIGSAGAVEPVDVAVECSDEAATFAEAGAVAAVCGSDVRVSGLTDPWSQTVVRADGLVEWTSAVEAERSLSVGGQWVPIDTSFTDPVDGRIGVAAPAVAMSFSDGGAGEPLAVVSKDGHELVYGMPFDLPAPVADVESRALTYSGVAPGVDLIVTVAPDGSGFTEVLRISSAEALEQAELHELVVPVELSAGLSWDVDSGGTLRAVDETGETVFVAPPPLAWDSGADGSPVVAQRGAFTADGASGLGVMGRTGGRWGVEGTDPSHPGEARPAMRVEVPVDGDRVEPLDVQVVDGSDDLVLRVDEELVREGTFPLYIDPSVSGSVTGRSYVQSGWPTTAHWNDVTNYGVGRCDPALGCSGVNIYRSFFQFSTAGLGALASADIVSATLTLYGQHSHSCTATPVEVWHTGGIGSGTTWNAQPGWTSLQASQTLAHKATCSNARDVSFNVTKAAQSSATQNSNQLTLGVKAASEATNTGWKRYENPRLSVTYSRVPGVGTGQKVNGAAKCGTSSAPTWVTTATPTFSWVVKDPDGGNVTGNLDLLKAGTMVWDAPETQTLKSGSTFSVAVPSGKIAHNTVYEWRSGGKDTQSRTSPYGPMKACWIKADLTNPATPGVTAKGVVENGVVPQPASAAFTISNASTDVVGYKVGFDISDPASQKVTAANSNRNLVVNAAEANLSPGAHTLVVRAVDAAGRSSGIKTFKYAVARASVAAYWTMNEPAATIPDWSPSAVVAPEGTSQPLVFTSNPAREPGVFAPFGFDSDLAVKLTGAQSGTARESTNTGAVTPVVSSIKAFTVTAYVKAGSSTPTTPGVVVSQDGTKASSFALVQATSGCPTGMASCWVLTRSKTDDDAGASAPVRVSSTAPVTPGAWQLLVARYTPGAGTAAGKMELTVCDEGTDPRGLFVECHTADGLALGGVTAVNATVPAPTWEAQGALRVGQQIVENAAGGYGPGNGFVGLVDDVRVYKAALTAADIQRIATGSDQAP